MITQDMAAEALLVGLQLIALWVMYFIFWKDYQMDAFRQRLFNLRGSLFEFAVENQLAFDHPAYGGLRQRINRLIRYAHHFNGAHFLLVYLFMRNDPMPRPHQEWQQAVETIEAERVRQRLIQFENEMAFLMVKRLMLSPFVFPVFLAALVRILVSRFFNRLDPPMSSRDLSAQMPGLERLEGHSQLEEQFA